MRYVSDVNYFFPSATIKILGFPLLLSWFLPEAGEPEGARRATGGSPADAIASMFIFQDVRYALLRFQRHLIHPFYVKIHE
jgi:hypothetical protein